MEHTGTASACMTTIVFYFYRLVLEEERDTVKERCFHTQTELTKLRSSDSLKRDGNKLKVEQDMSLHVMKVISMKEPRPMYW